jgi:hypothetical protein
MLYRGNVAERNQRKKIRKKSSAVILSAAKDQESFCCHAERSEGSGKFLLSC